MYKQRNFAIFSTTEIDKIDFSQVLETSAETIRKNVLGDKTFVKWDGESLPSSIELLTTLEGPYTYAEILDILSTPEWTAPMDEEMI